MYEKRYVNFAQVAPIIIHGDVIKWWTNKIEFSDVTLIVLKFIKCDEMVVQMIRLAR